MNIGTGNDVGIESTIMAKLTGDTKLAKIVSNNDTIWIEMLTDATGSQMGFFFSLLRVETLNSGMFTQRISSQHCIKSINLTRRFSRAKILSGENDQRLIIFCGIFYQHLVLKKSYFL